MFLKDRLKFYRVSGMQVDSAEALRCLIAFEEYNAHKLAESGISGALISPILYPLLDSLNPRDGVDILALAFRGEKQALGIINTLA